jgi:hypothetical protein
VAFCIGALGASGPDRGSVFHRRLTCHEKTGSVMLPSTKATEAISISRTRRIMI